MENPSIGEKSSNLPGATQNEVLSTSIENSADNAGTVDTTLAAPKTTTPMVSSATADPGLKKVGSTVASKSHRDLPATASWIEPPYHYDAASVFRAKSHRLKEAVVPDFEVNRFEGRKRLALRCQRWSTRGAFGRGV